MSILPPFAPAYDSCPGSTFALGDLVAINYPYLVNTSGSNTFLGIVAAFRFDSTRDKTRVLIIYDYSRLSRRGKEITCEWVDSNLLYLIEHLTIEELLTYEKAIVREYFCHYITNGRLIVRECPK